MTIYRVDIDGQTVWSQDIDDSAGGSAKHFPAELLSRPGEADKGVAHPSPHYLYIGDTVVGIQRSHADESEQCEIAAAWLYASSLEAHPAAANHGELARQMKDCALDARINAADARGDRNDAAKLRFEKAKVEYEADIAAAAALGLDVLLPAPTPPTTEEN